MCFLPSISLKIEPSRGPLTESYNLLMHCLASSLNNADINNKYANKRHSQSGKSRSTWKKDTGGSCGEGWVSEWKCISTWAWPGQVPVGAAEPFPGQAQTNVRAFLLGSNWVLRNGEPLAKTSECWNCQPQFPPPQYLQLETAPLHTHLLLGLLNLPPHSAVYSKPTTSLSDR